MKILACSTLVSALLVPHLVDSFVPATQGRRTTTFLKSSTAAPPGEAKAPAKKEEKFTKEALELLDILNAKEKGEGPGLIVAQTAPAVRIALPEEFDKPPLGFSPQAMVAGLKALGFDLVLDTVSVADLTIMEEGTELMTKIKEHMAAKENGEEDVPPLRLFTSCCPGWMGFVEKSCPEMAPFVSSCKSPHMMYGSVVKTFSEKLLNTPAKDVYFTSVMPCVKKRGESDAAAFSNNGVRDIDNVITTKDLAQLLKLKGIDPSTLEEQPYDTPFQNEADGGTGAGQLFGATGGVMEAAVRTVYEVVTGKKLPRMELDAVRGLDGVKEAVLPLYDDEGNGLPLDLKVAVCCGLGNAKKLLKKINEGEADYHFIEVMACLGGCINGGGQPRAKPERVQERLDKIYELDRSMPRRRSHENPLVQKMYDELLGGEYGSHKAHELLHVEPVYGRVPGPKKPKKTDLKP